jgi:hypothetical protein
MYTERREICLLLLVPLSNLVITVTKTSPIISHTPQNTNADPTVAGRSCELAAVLNTDLALSGHDDPSCVMSSYTSSERTGMMWVDSGFAVRPYITSAERSYIPSYSAVISSAPADLKVLQNFPSIRRPVHSSPSYQWDNSVFSTSSKTNSGKWNP